MQNSRGRLAALSKSCLAFAVIAFVILPSMAQTKSKVNGGWYWEGRPDKTGSRSVVGLTIKQTGNRVSGSYYVSSTGGPEDDTTDAASIPFSGTISGDTINIEFDPEDLHTIDETNFRYHKPKGKKANTASLTLKDGKLEVKQLEGWLADKSMNIPRIFTMKRA